MTFSLRLASSFVALACLYPHLTSAAPSTVDPCVKISEKLYVPPSDVLACYKAFPFSEALRQNVLTNIARVFDFFTFEEYYLNSPPPFQESTTDIRKTLERINSTKYETDYDFNKDLFDFTTQLNDGHTRWWPDCYTIFQNLLPTPIINIEENGVQGVYIAFDIVELFTQLGPEYSDYFDSIGFDWKRLQGAKVLEIEGQDPYAYVDHVAKTISGNYLDHGIRVNSVFSSYRISSGGVFSQRVGDLAGPWSVDQDSVTFKLITINSTTAETVKVPFLASYLGAPFTDKDSYWETNCAPKEGTNGRDLKAVKRKGPPRYARAAIIDKSLVKAVDLPPRYIPTLPALPGSDGVIKSFVLPDQKTGVMYVGTFDGDFVGFQDDVVAAVDSFKEAGVTQLLIDVTNNGGGYVCLGQFLHRYLVGSDLKYAGFNSTQRATPFVQRIVAAEIELGLDTSVAYYTGDNYAFENGTIIPSSYNYMSPPLPFEVNGRQDPTSQRVHDVCEQFFFPTLTTTPPFDLSKIAIVGNGNCGSTCAMFITLMHELHKTKIAVFGGKPGEKMEFKGMAGNQVMEWADLDTEIKTAGLKDDPMAPPDLLVSGNFRHNWRTAWSYLNKDAPIAYLSALPDFRFAYTKDTYNNPQNLWTFAVSKLF